MLDLKDKYTVIRDTREQPGQGWFFQPQKSCIGTIIKTLATGDYTIEGYEKILTIERKGTLAEFAGNLTQSRFERELIRMKSIPCPFVVLEFSMDDLYRWPRGAGLPKNLMATIKTSPHFLAKKFLELQLKYPYVHFIFAGMHGKDIASSIFKRILEREAV